MAPAWRRHPPHRRIRRARRRQRLPLRPQRPVTGIEGAAHANPHRRGCVGPRRLRQRHRTRRTAARRRAARGGTCRRALHPCGRDAPAAARAPAAGRRRRGAHRPAEQPRAGRQPGGARDQRLRARGGRAAAQSALHLRAAARRADAGAGAHAQLQRAAAPHLALARPVRQRIAADGAVARGAGRHPHRGRHAQGLDPGGRSAPGRALPARCTRSRGRGRGARAADGARGQLQPAAAGARAVHAGRDQRAARAGRAGGGRPTREAHPADGSRRRGRKFHLARPPPGPARAARRRGRHRSPGPAAAAGRAHGARRSALRRRLPRLHPRDGVHRRTDGGRRAQHHLRRRGRHPRHQEGLRAGAAGAAVRLGPGTHRPRRGDLHAVGGARARGRRACAQRGARGLARLAHRLRPRPPLPRRDRAAAQVHPGRNAAALQRHALQRVGPAGRGPHAHRRGQRRHRGAARLLDRRHRPADGAHGHVARRPGDARRGQPWRDLRRARTLE
jgi:hypothetical protein